MKKLVMLTVVAAMVQMVSAQTIDYNLDKGYLAEGYDVTEYFNDKAVEGKNAYTGTHDGVRLKFSSSANLEKFKSDTNKYVPLYGGYCAYAMAKRGKKVEADGDNYLIQDGKVLLFSKGWTYNTRDDWQEEGASKLKPKADANWEKVKYKK